jgi:hypothetical protein
VKRFSLKAFVFVTLLHIAGTTLLLGAAVSHIKAYEQEETFLWLSILSWIWEPIPMSLSRHFHFGPSGFFYYLTLPWSVCVGAFFGFLLPRLSGWRHQTA